MNTEFKPLKVQFQIRRNLSDFRKPRYTLNFQKLGVIADGRTLDEVRDRGIYLTNKLGPSVTPEFVVMAE